MLIHVFLPVDPKSVGIGRFGFCAAQFALSAIPVMTHFEYKACAIPEAAVEHRDAAANRLDVVDPGGFMVCDVMTLHSDMVMVMVPLKEVLNMPIYSQVCLAGMAAQLSRELCKRAGISKEE